MTDDTDSQPPQNGDENIFSFPLPADDLLQTFQLETSLIRGRVIRMGKVLTDIVAPHHYPAPIAHIVAQAATVALTLSSMLKFQGIFTLQMQGDGPLKMVVADVINHNEVRACASYSKEDFENLDDGGDEAWPVSKLLGKGYIAFTVDQGPHTERYQGIVELQADNVADSVAHYFTQSEQLRTFLKLAVVREGRQWRSGAIMIQSLPLEPKMVQDEIHGAYEEDWNRAKILLDTVTETELTDPRLSENALLMRLFHEEGVRVYDPMEVKKGCRCTPDKLRNIIAMMPKEDQADMVMDGKITLTCEFCNLDFVFAPEDLNTATEDDPQTEE